MNNYNSDDDPYTEHFAHLLTILIATVNPSINEETTYDLLLDLLDADLTVARMETYGVLIRATGGTVTSGEVH